MDKTKNIAGLEASRCYGCGACAVICPCRCISMIPDAEGFDYPVISDLQCVFCGKCLTVCPSVSAPIFSEPEKSYAGWSSQPDTRESSTSGGIFGELAKRVIVEGGVVCGAAFTDDYHHVAHTCIDSCDRLDMLRMSKYVQSRTLEGYAQCLAAVRENRLVLFAGTPCQVASLNNMVSGTERKNLITCDIVCHGVPSPRVFDAYLSEEEQSEKSPIIGYSFRDKQDGWNFPAIRLMFKNGRVKRRIPQLDSYFNGYSLNVFLRPSCYSCPFAQRRRVGDLTIADCWRVAASHPKLDDNKGTSLVFASTTQGERLIKNLVDTQQCMLENYDKTLACARNTPLREPPVEPEVRKLFFNRFQASASFKESASVYRKKRLFLRNILVYWVKRLGWPVLRRFQ